MALVLRIGMRYRKELQSRISEFRLDLRNFARVALVRPLYGFLLKLTVQTRTLDVKIHESFLPSQCVCRAYL